MRGGWGVDKNFSQMREIRGLTQTPTAMRSNADCRGHSTTKKPENVYDTYSAKSIKVYDGLVLNI